MFSAVTTSLNAGAYRCQYASRPEQGLMAGSAYFASALKATRLSMTMGVSAGTLLSAASTFFSFKMIGFMNFSTHRQRDETSLAFTPNALPSPRPAPIVDWTRGCLILRLDETDLCRRL